MLKKGILLITIIIMIISCGKDGQEENGSVTIAEPETTAVPEAEEDKKALNPDAYAEWENLSRPTIAENGKWIYYIASPNRGDNVLTLYGVESGKKHDFDRVKKVSFSPADDFITFMRTPAFETERQAKLDKVKKNKMPKDSLCVYFFEDDTLLTVPRVKSYSINDEGRPRIALLLEKPLPAEEDTTAEEDTSAVTDSSMLADTTGIDTSTKKIKTAEKEEEKKKEKKPKVREQGTPFWVWDPVAQDTVILDYVSSYVMSDKGDRVLALTKLKGDPDSVRLSIIDPQKKSIDIILETAGQAKSFRFDKEGDQLAFLFSDDSTKKKEFDIYYWKKGRSKAKSYITGEAKGIPDGWGVSNIRFPSFSKDGKRLFFGTAPIVEEEPEDTLLKNEKVHLDLWSWHDPLLQTHQKKQLRREKNRNYIARVDVGRKKVIQLADTLVPTIKISSDYDEDLLVGESNLPYRKLISWESLDYYDFYLVNVRTGEKEKILEKKAYTPELSPQGKYMLWYDHADSNWYAYDVDNKHTRCLTADLEVAFYNEEDDRPSPAGPYGFAQWGLGDHYAFVYDRYDIWKFDLSGEKAPLNVTKGEGRENKTIYRYIHLNSDLDYAPIKPVVLSAFNEKTKENGYASVRFYEGSVPEHLIYTDHKYSHLEEAEDADVLIWRKGDYRHYPDLWVSDMQFGDKAKVSALNPQQSEYRWADVELVEWKNSDGVELQGLLYIPDDLDTSKEHPMIIYYYEKYSDYLHQYFMPRPSYSTVNKSMYPSNGYILFIPDIVYEVGHPGKSGLDCVESGLDMLLEKYSFIDENKVALQGQSWGGYQTAYFITQTDRFAAAMAGAPVSNMTSAYGGIRWFSGLSRMMQYEGGQSRIGGTLWESFDLYVENSPVFFADKIKTPLLMMHNDNDGAVPWTQGIEMFVAMRRLQKPAWMLVYNNDTHNLKTSSWGNRMDLTVRMKQFFDHYLKGEPMPLWMKEGISAQEKGRELKYELTGPEK